MVEALDSVRGVSFGDPIYESDSIVVQPLGPSAADEIAVYDGDNLVASSVPQIQEILDEGEASFPRHSYSGSVDGDSVVLESKKGDVVEIPDARAVVEDLRDAE